MCLIMNTLKLPAAFCFPFYLYRSEVGHLFTFNVMFIVFIQYAFVIIKQAEPVSNLLLKLYQQLETISQQI